MSKKIENKEVETVVEAEVIDLDEDEDVVVIEVEEEAGKGKKKFGKKLKNVAIATGLLIGGVLLGRGFAAKSARSEDGVDGEVEDGADIEVTEF